MKAVAVTPSRREVALVDHPEPRITGANQVKLRVLDVGICGTDREICAFDYGTPPPGEERLVIGHEMLGKVVEVGADVSNLAVGDLVVPMVRRPCPHPTCAACVAGRPDFCYTGDFTERGIKERHGYMTEYVVDERRFMHGVPPVLRDVAVLIEPLTIAEKALIEVNGVQQRLPWACRSQPAGQAAPADRNGAHGGHTAVVLGAGPVGLLGAMVWLNAGFRTIVYSRAGRADRRADLVESLGARFVSSEEHTPAQLAATAGNVDVVYEAAGASSVAFEVMKVLGTNGVFVFTGVPGRKAPIPVDTDLLMRRLVLMNQVVLGTVNAGHDAFEAAIRDLTVFAARWPAALRGLITRRLPIEQYREPLLNRVDGIKSVVTLAPELSS